MEEVPKHPRLTRRGSVFYIRVKVPEALRSMIGKREILKSLNTRNPREALERVRAESALVDVQFKEARRLAAGPPPLARREASGGPRQAAPSLLQVQALEAELRAQQGEVDGLPSAFLGALARRWGDKQIALLAEGKLYPWDFESQEERDAAWRALEEDEADSGYSDWEAVAASLHQTAREVLADTGIALDPGSASFLELRRLLRREEMAVLRHRREALEERQFSRGANGVNPVPPTMLPQSDVERSHAPNPVPLPALLEGWRIERQLLASDKTFYTTSKIIGHMTRFLGHDDAARLTAEDIVRWKESMLSGPKPLALVTIRTKLGWVRTIMAWAVSNRKLPSNPAVGITMPVSRKPKNRQTGYSDEEAARILNSCRSAKGFLRWVPWICAFSGARLSEVCQLRVRDIKQIDRIWCFDINYEAGPLKTPSSARFVPLHPLLQVEGFLQYVAGLPEQGRVFPDIQPDRFGSFGGSASKVIGRWVRETIGIRDRSKAPSHAWRHRFKTESRVAKIPKDIGDVLTGHSLPDVSGGYGKYPVTLLFEEISKLAAPPGVEFG